VFHIAAEEAELKLEAAILLLGSQLAVFTKFVGIGFFSLDEDFDFDWAAVCEEDAAGQVLVLSDCFGLSVWARAVFKKARLLRLILA